MAVTGQQQVPGPHDGVAEFLASPAHRDLTDRVLAAIDETLGQDPAVLGWTLAATGHLADHAVAGARPPLVVEPLVSAPPLQPPEDWHMDTPATRFVQQATARLLAAEQDKLDDAVVDSMLRCVGTRVERDRAGWLIRAVPDPAVPLGEVEFWVEGA